MKQAKLATLLTITLGSPAFLNARMIYDPVSYTIYSSSERVNQDEYRNLLHICCQMGVHTGLRKKRISNSKKILKQVQSFLKKVNTPTALELLKDIKENKIYDQNGKVRVYLLDL